ncbi:MAG: alpha/beta hydrolase [Hahellaceae bacterium]|nr:alpha/beta hydrolase [Hahellaceae bacterium]
MSKHNRPVSSSTPVILLHGLFMTHSFWAPDNYRPLSEHFPVHAISLPGHFPSPPLSPGESLSKEAVLACLDAQLDALVGETPIVLIGHSTGGMLALFYASQRPHRVCRVISVGGTENGAEEDPTYRFLQYVTAHWGKLGNAMLPPTLWLTSATAWLHRHFMREAMAHPDEMLKKPEVRGIIDRYLPDLHRLDRASMTQMLRDLQFFDASEELQQMQVPTLIICGDKDCYVTRDRTYRLGDLIPHSQVHIFADCGHMCMWEKPEMFYGLILKFLGVQAAKGHSRSSRGKEKLTS